jgi:hypothetical protein
MGERVRSFRDHHRVPNELYAWLGNRTTVASRARGLAGPCTSKQAGVGYVRHNNPALIE